MIRITVWNEYKHEREYENIRKVYPEGIHGCIAGFLGKEESEQKLVIKLSGLMFVIGFVIAGFNFRFQWIVLPDFMGLFGIPCTA